MAKLGSREFFALLVLSLFVLSAVSASAIGNSADLFKQKISGKYFEKSLLQTKPAPAFAGNSNFNFKLPFIIKTTSTCTDTDSGPNIETGDNIIRYGTCVDDAGKHEDSCASPISLTEYTCSGGRCLSYEAYCPNGCESGECIICGNGRKQGSEACDGNDFGGTNCKTAGFDSGTIYCTKDCNIDLSHCKRNQQDTTGNSQDQGQGQGSGNGNGQSGQGQQGQGDGTSQSQGYQQGCYDSDGGSYAKGFCIDKYGYHEDHCEGCNMPQEYECGIPKGETDYVCGMFRMQLQLCQPTCIYD